MMRRTAAPAALPSVAAGPDSGFHPYRRFDGPVSDRIDTANQRLGLNGELRRQIALARYRAGRRAILDGFADQCHRGASVPVRVNQHRTGTLLAIGATMLSQCHNQRFGGVPVGADRDPLSLDSATS